MPMILRVLIVSCLCAAACRSTQSLEKGDLQPVNVEREKLDQAYQPRRFALVIGVPRTQDGQ